MTISQRIQEHEESILSRGNKPLSIVNTSLKCQWSPKMMARTVLNKLMLDSRIWICICEYIYIYIRNIHLYHFFIYIIYILYILYILHIYIHISHYIKDIHISQLNSPIVAGSIPLSDAEEIIR